MSSFFVLRDNAPNDKYYEHSFFTLGFHHRLRWPRRKNKYWIFLSRFCYLYRRRRTGIPRLTRWRNLKDTTCFRPDFIRAEFAFCSLPSSGLPIPHHANRKSNTVSTRRKEHNSLWNVAESTTCREYIVTLIQREHMCGRQRMLLAVACISNKHSKGRLSAKFPTDEPKPKLSCYGESIMEIERRRAPITLYYMHLSRSPCILYRFLTWSLERTPILELHG